MRTHFSEKSCSQKDSTINDQILDLWSEFCELSLFSGKITIRSSYSNFPEQTLTTAETHFISIHISLSLFRFSLKRVTGSEYKRLNCHLRLAEFVCNAKGFATVFILLFFYFSLSRQCFWTDMQMFFYVCFRDCFRYKYRENFIVYIGKWLAKSLLNLKFRWWEHGMWCALEQIIMAKLSGHIQSRISFECRISHSRQNYCNCRNIHNSTTTVSMVIKLGMVVTYHKGVLFINSNDPFLT